MKSISLGMLLSAGLTVFAINACTSGGDSDTDKTGTGGGANGTGATANGTGATASGTGATASGTGGDGLGGSGSGDPDAVACPAATAAALLDFAPGMGGAPSTTDDTFGDFTTTFSGGSAFYPDTLTSDTTGENWHISGEINTWSGFNLYFNNCTKVDASAFTGIKLTISGDTAGKPITITVGTAANQVTSAFLEANGGTNVTPSFGRCTPNTATPPNQYDGTCKEFTKTIDVTSTAETIELTWADLTGGAPETTLNPAEITSIGWFFTPPDGLAAGATVTPYDVDIVVDDIGFIE